MIAHVFNTVNNQNMPLKINKTYINHIPAETFEESVPSRITTTITTCTARILNTTGMGTPYVVVKLNVAVESST